MSDDHDGNDGHAADDAPDGEVLEGLFDVIEDRKETLPEGSYTASLFTHEKGENRVLEKVGEESTEFVLAAKDDDGAEMAAEGADLVYHLLVALSMHDVDVEELLDVLRERQG
ncbi:phosphoribosyl-ATP pyrophosphohydrolase [Halarchaeum rubridurum]|uniref:Phosphoribosyl-ATP pyrophosphatase n=1 Tax=Halarchaeum rubridurum TaxID=489911 RepID=A0A830G191_9EURY|nr:phosphoribosyl-ATP diphosphatase [Halarchaeum rubridurum]MBP1954947.1 phosphoribosyl-ATP pyrophosphohydrolase [Halarchaeum rubridurum]GGM70181.1 phosphoribosyl-ATP pyrophosphatase [Halarchaeum rubridurum]